LQVARVSQGYQVGMGFRAHLVTWEMLVVEAYKAHQAHLVTWENWVLQANQANQEWTAILTTPRNSLGIRIYIKRFQEYRQRCLSSDINSTEGCS